MIMVLVNENLKQPNSLKEIKCSRYCHTVKCIHFEKKLKEAPSKWNQCIQKIYAWNINALKENSVGVSYQRINIYVYVLAFPLLMATLLWGIIRK